MLGYRQDPTRAAVHAARLIRRSSFRSQGRSSRRRVWGVSSMRASTSASHACRAISLSRAVPKHPGARIGHRWLRSKPPAAPTPVSLHFRIRPRAGPSIEMTGQTDTGFRSGPTQNPGIDGRTLAPAGANAASPSGFCASSDITQSSRMKKKTSQHHPNSRSWRLPHPLPLLTLQRN